MLKKIVQTYQKLLDEKLENWTIIVLLIVGLVVSASFITKDINTTLYTKSNILEITNISTSQNNIIEINGVKYKLILENTSK